MPNQPTFFCTAIPDAKVSATGELTFAVLVTPIVRGEEINVLPDLFANWPEKTGLPFTFDKAKIAIDITLEEHDAPAGAPPLKIDGDWRYMRPDLKLPLTTTTAKAQKLAERAWNQIFDKNKMRVEPLLPHAAEGNLGGATPTRPAAAFEDAPKNLEEAAKTLRERKITVEGVGTQDLMEKVVLPLLRAHYFIADKKAEHPGPKDADLDQLGFALERLDRFGSAGSSSAPVSKAATAAPDKPPAEESDKPEFHELVSTIGDDRCLLQLLGLVFRIQVKLGAGWDKQVDRRQFNLLVKLKEMVGGVESDAVVQRATPCALTKNTKAKKWTCHVDCNRDAQKKESSQDSLVDAGFIAVKIGGGEPRIDAVQAEPISILRAALRDREDRENLRRKRSPDAAPSANRTREQRRAPLLLAHGITIFRRPGAEFLRGTKESLTGEKTRGEALWQPEEIARGFVVDVRVRPPWAKNEAGTPDDDWADIAWEPLCRRTITYTLPAEGSNKAVRFFGQDEACLGVSTTEAATPLGGFLLGPLDYSLKDDDASNIAAQRRELTTDDLAVLGYDAKLPRPRINHFVVATPSGLVVVADVPTPEELEKGERRGPITRRLAELTSEGRSILSGGWVELSGASARGGAYFVAMGAEFADEFLGAAALASRSVQDRVLEKLAPGGSLVAWAIERRRFDLIATGKDAAGKPIEINLPRLQADPAVSLLFWRFASAEDAKPLRTWLETNVTAQHEPILAEARGEAVLAVLRREDFALDPLRKNLVLVFVRVVEGLNLEFRPVAEGDPEVETLPIILTATRDAELRTLTQPRVAVNDLPEGSRFRVTLKKIDFDDPDFSIVTMVEISREREATLLKISPAKNGNQVLLRIGNLEKEYFAAENALAEIQDFTFFPPPPAEQSKDEAGVNRDEAETYFRGSWSELAHLFQRNDLCTVRLGIGENDNLQNIESITLLQRDRGQYYFGWFSDLADGEETSKFGNREDVVIFRPLLSEGEQGKRWAVIVDDSTVLGTGAPFPGGQWRARQLPPLQTADGKTGLTRVFFDTPPSEGHPTHARFIELHHTLSGTLKDITDPATGQSVVITLQPKGPGTPAFSFQAPSVFDWKTHREWILAASEVELLINDEGRLGEMRVRVPGRWERNEFRFIAAHNNTPLKLDQPETEYDDAGSINGTQFEVRLNFVEVPGKTSARARIRRANQRRVRVQLKSGSDHPGEDAVDARVLFNRDDYFAPAEGRDRTIFFLPAVEAGGKAAPLIEKLAASQLPIEFDALAGVLIDKTGNARSGVALRQWHTLHTLRPPSLEAEPGKARWIFGDKQGGWVAGRVSAAPAYPPEAHTLWTLGFLTPPDGDVLRPPILLEKIWPDTTKLDHTAVKEANLTLKPGEELLPDQVIVDDALVHWAGNSLAKNEKRRQAFDSVGEGTPEKSQLEKRIEVSIEEGELPPLRVGWQYEFRLRAVWVTADAVDFTLPTPANARLRFHPFGSDYPAIKAFQRTEPFSPPRIGWRHEGQPEDGAPDEGGWVSAPATTYEEQATARDHLEKWWMLPPRVASKVTVKPDPLAGTPADLVVRSDRAWGARLTLVPEKDPSFPSVRPLDALPGAVRIVLRPAEIAPREAERLGVLEQWEALNPTQALYWDVLWAYDEVEPCDAWWERLPAFKDAVKKGQKFNYKDEAKFFQPEKGATEGRILHRLPDPAASGLRLAVVQETSPGIWTELEKFIVNEPGAADDNPFNFIELRSLPGQVPHLWPACREFSVEVRVKTNGQPVFTKQNSRTVVVHVPEDADWHLEVRTVPHTEALEGHAFDLFRSEGGTDEWDYARRGEHPLLSPATRIRLRHATNQPRVAPRKIALRMVPRGPGDTDVQFQGRYEIDRPSTGSLLIQAALEMDCVDDPQAPLPRVPAPELSRILAVARESEEIPKVEPAGGLVLGRSSDSTRTLRSAEFAISELQPRVQSVSPFGATEEPIDFSHAIGDARHRRVFYRVLAISRWETLFTRELRKNNQPGKSSDWPLCQPNPLRGPFTEAEAKKLEAQARALGEPEPWRWYRVEVPATKRPDPVVLGEGRLRTAFSWQPQHTVEKPWSGGNGRWHFSRTRLPVCRLWLARPWYSSGADEKLAVLCLHKTRVKRAEKERVLRTVTRWAVDAADLPLPKGERVASAGLITRASFLSAEPGSPAEIEVPAGSSEGAAQVNTTRTDTPQRGAQVGAPIRVGLAVHTPRFHVEERQWYCDIYLQAKVYRPFLYLSVARYQPYAIAGAELSEPLHLHPVQVLPARTLDISLVAEGGALRAEITVTGMIAAVLPREVICHLQREAGETMWHEEEVPAGFDVRAPRGVQPAEAAPNAVDLDACGDFWQALAFRTPDTAAAYSQPLMLVNAATGTYRGVVLIEAHHTKNSPRLRFSVEEIENIPAATDLDPALADTSRPPVYFDQVVIDPAALAMLG